MWGLLLSAATIVASLVTHKPNNSNNSNSNRNQGFIVGSSFIMTPNDRLFLSGAVLGVGVSIFCATLATHFRFRQRLRLLLWQSERSTFRHPTSLLSAITSILSTSTSPHDESKSMVRIIQKSIHGSVLSIVSWQETATSHLNISVLSLEPGVEIPSCRSVGVEFYYVLSGTGQVSQQGVNDTGHIRAGDCFVVDVQCIRWLSNSQGREPLILLRVTDGGHAYSRPGSNLHAMRLDPNQHRRASTMAMLREGMRQVQSFASDYQKPANS